MNWVWHGTVTVNLVSVILAVSFMALSIPSISGTNPNIGDIPRQSDLPATADFNATNAIEEIILRINESLMAKHVQALQDYKTRYAFRGDKCFAVADYINEHFLQNGLETSYHDFTYGGYRMRNVIGQKTGATSPDETYIICAHYDSVSTYSGMSWTNAPGADDNGSGVAAVMAAAELLSDYNFTHTIRFIAFSGEELGLKGSMNYTDHIIALGENIRGVVNLDMIAFNPPWGTKELYLCRENGDKMPAANESVYGPAPANDTAVHFWLGHDYIIDCNLFLEEQGAPGTPLCLVEGPSGDYLLNRTTGFIDLSSGIGPISEFENLTAWYNYSASGSMVNSTKQTIQKYGDIISLSPLDLLFGSSDHASFAPAYPAIMLIEKRFNTNPNYHEVTDTVDYLNFTYCANITQLAVATIAELAQMGSGDVMPPSHSPGSPPGNGYAPSVPCISIETRDPSPLNLSALTMHVNGIPVTPTLDAIPLGFNLSYIPPAPYSDGAMINVSVSASDILGNAFDYSWGFTVDAIPPDPPTNLALAGSRVELIKRGLVLNVGASYDLKYAQSPDVIFKDGEYKMWYTAYDGSLYRIAYANSSDGLAWAKYGAVLQPGTSGQPDDYYVAHPSVVFDGEYKMWYSGSDGTTARIMLANSSDGINWLKNGVALDIGSTNEPDSYHSMFPSVLKTTEYKMWYTGFDGLRHRILYANSSDGLVWTKYMGDITPEGAGIFCGDGVIWSPDVAYHNGTYHMYYTRYDGSRFKIIHSRSDDGIHWNEFGMAIDVGAAGEYDMLEADQCCVMMADAETKVWYSAYNGTNRRILFANITPSDPANDLTLSWAPSASTDVVRYEVFRETRPSAFRYPLETAHPEFYAPPAGQTSWTFERSSETNITAYGPVTGSSPPYFYLPDDNILDISLFMRTGSGEWQSLAQDMDFSIDKVLGHVTILAPQFEAGCSLYAWYNHSAGRALRVSGSSTSDIGAGSSANYYYIVRAVDKAGNHAYCADMAGKIATSISAPWTLIANPFLSSSTPIGEALAGLDWAGARTWEPLRPGHWTINRPGVPEEF
ncbi:MAG: M20/M25/M40 family metallo-hydrolase, partial [Thermoplasmata archaeon]